MSAAPTTADRGRSVTPDAVPAPSARRLATRARLISAAAEVFAERGFGRATVEDVCDRAGYTRGAFYSNFESLDELFFALHTVRAAALVTAVADAVTIDTGVPAEVTTVMDRVVAALPVSRDQHLLALEFTAHALRHPEIAAALARHRSELRTALAPIVAQGLAAVGIVADAGAVEEVTRAVIAVHEGMSTQELLEPDAAGLPDLRRDLLAAVVSGSRP